MRLRVTLVREEGPLHGSCHSFDHKISDPELEELRYPTLPFGDITAEYLLRRQEATVRRDRFVNLLSAAIARELARHLEKVLDDEAARR